MNKEELLEAFSDTEWENFKAIHADNETIGFVYPDNSNSEHGSIPKLHTTYMKVKEYDKYRKEHRQWG